jgi:exodeoxyribonuclease VII large subunit
VLAELKAAVADRQARLVRAVQRLREDRRNQLAAAARGLPRPTDLLAVAQQRFDLVAGRLNAALDKNASAHERDLTRIGARLSPSLLERPLRTKAERYEDLSARMRPAIERRLARAAEGLDALDKLRRSFDPKGPLKRGYAFVHGPDGGLVRSAAELSVGDGVRLEFGDGERGAVIDGEGPPRRAPARKAATPTRAAQGDLF